MPLSARFPVREPRGVELPLYGLAQRFARTELAPSRPLDVYVHTPQKPRREGASWAFEPADSRIADFWPRNGIESPRYVDMAVPMAGLRIHDQKPSCVRSHPYYHAPPSHRVFLRDTMDQSGASRPGRHEYAHARFPSSPFPDSNGRREPTRANNNALIRLSSRDYSLPKRRAEPREDTVCSSRIDHQKQWRAEPFTPASRCELRKQTDRQELGGADNDDATTDLPPPPPSHTASEIIHNPKQSRYLREMDRRLILSRLNQGEKQSVLAKEYNVSRSTICNLFRQRDVVLARKNENPMARHPKKTRRRVAATSQTTTVEGKVSLVSPRAESIRVQPQTHSEGNQLDQQVVEIQSHAIILLKQNLLDRRTPHDAFKRCCSRLMRLLIEESLAIIASRRVSVAPPRALDECVCALSMEETGRAMLDMFTQLEPHAPSSLLSQSATRGDSSLPLPWNAHDVLLLDVVATSGRAVCAAIEKLLARGAHEKRISLVALFVSTEVVTQVHLRYPSVQILTTAIDAPTRPGSSLAFAASTFLSRFQSAAWSGSQVLWTAC